MRSLTRVEVSVVLDASPEEVWRDVADISSHVEWMQDAVLIQFRGDQRQGVGVVFDCETKIGPLRLTDRMTVTAWEAAERMGVRHEGAVTGDGLFTLAAVVGSDGHVRTRFTWAEQLQFPWFLAGPVGAVVARPIFTWIWGRNLTALARRFPTA